MPVVIADKVKFLDAIKPVGFGAFILGIFRSLGTVVIVALFVFLAGVLTTQIPLLIIGALIALVLGIWRAYNRSKSWREWSTSTQLDVLGEVIADAVFLPLFIIASTSGDVSERDGSFIRDEMREWGYDSDFIERFLGGLKEKRAGEIHDLFVDVGRFDKGIAQSFRTKGTGWISRKEVNKKDLRRKSLKLCGQLLEDENGVVDKRKEQYLEDLRRVIKV